MSKKAKTTKSRRTINIYITVGLPGCGKTTSFNKISNQSINNFRVDVDYIMRLMYSYGACVDFDPEAILSRAKSEERLWTIPYSIYIDGPFFNDETVVKFLNGTIKWLYNTFAAEFSVSEYEYDFCANIHYWHPNVEVCLFNDAIRGREQTAEHTIKTTEIKYPDVDNIKSELNEKFNNVILIEHISQKADVIKSIIKKYSSKCDDYTLRSSSWNPAKEAPLDFDAFDDIIFTLKPDITLMLYKKIWKKCIRTSHKTDSDYYSSYVDDIICYEADVNNLIETLEEYHLL